jgi:ABC-type glycerol-3-phosphate transport system substrate-binding protein
MNKHIKKLCFLVTIIMVLSLLSSCFLNKQGKDTSESEQTTKVTEAGESKFDKNGFLKDDLPSDLNFGNTGVNILYWEDVERPEFFVENQNGNDVNDAIFNRNAVVETRLGIVLNYTGTKGNYANQDNFVKTAEASVSAGGTFDVFAGYSMTGATLAIKGLTENLIETDHIDLSKPWWPQSLIDEATINDKLYFCSGDISSNCLHMMYAMFFNKKILAQYGLEDPYELVLNNKWTLEKMMEMSQGVYMDLTLDNVRNYGDQFGFASINLHFDALFTGSGLKTIEKDENGMPMISPSFGSSKAQDLVETLVSFLHKTNDAYGSGTTSKDSSAQAFANGQLLFTVDRSYISSGTLIDVSDFKYGILPMCKYDEDQDNYVTVMGFPYTLYSISTASPNVEKTGAAIECLASESYRQLTPALFEEGMKVKYAHDETDSKMYDIIRQTVYIDLGRIFTTSLNNVTYSLFRDAVKNSNTGWMVNVRGVQPSLEAKLDAINTKFE